MAWSWCIHILQFRSIKVSQFPWAVGPLTIITRLPSQSLEILYCLRQIERHSLTFHAPLLVRCSWYRLGVSRCRRPSTWPTRVDREKDGANYALLILGSQWQRASQLHYEHHYCAWRNRHPESPFFIPGRSKYHKGAMDTGKRPDLSSLITAKDLIKEVILVGALDFFYR